MRAFRAISRMSADIASENPAPTATPLIPATIGLSQPYRKFRGRRLTQLRSSSCWAIGESGLAASPEPVRSRPEQNASPTPVMPITQTLSFFDASSTASRMPHASALLSAFFRSGRFN